LPYTYIYSFSVGMVGILWIFIIISWLATAIVENPFNCVHNEKNSIKPEIPHVIYKGREIVVFFLRKPNEKNKWYFGI
jgi:hypothetical protein